MRVYYDKQYKETGEDVIPWIWGDFQMNCERAHREE